MDHQVTTAPRRGGLARASADPALKGRDLTAMAGLFALEELTEEDFEAWSWSPLPYGAHEMTAVAVAWAAAGIGSASAVQFCALGWDVDEAEPWHRTGYLPTQADFADKAILYNRIKHLDAYGSIFPGSTREEWWSSGLTPRWVCLSLGAGLTTVAEALAGTRHRPEGGELERLRLTLRCLRRGIDINEVNLGRAF